MSLDSIVSVTITTGTAAVSQTGFGTPLIAGYHTHYADTVREYDSADGLTALTSDGFNSADPIYLAAQALLAQSPRVTSFKIAKLGTSATQTIKLTPVAYDDHDYNITINGSECSINSGSSATVASICTALAAEINSTVGSIVTATDNTTYVSVAADTANRNYVYSDYEHANLQVTDTTTAQASLSTVLDTVVLADDDWYCLILAQQSEADLEAAAAWVETKKKILLCDSSDYGIISSSSTDVASDMKAQSYARTALIYTDTVGEYAGAAWAGKMLTSDPGSENWAYKTLAGITATILTATEASYIQTKRANQYSTVAGLDLTQYGKTFSSSQGYVDITRLIDWVQSRIQENVLSALANNQKIPFTNAGIALIKGVIAGVLEQGISNGAIALDPAYTVSAPDAADVSATDKANRLLPDVRFTATITGAVNTIDITGTLSI